MVLSGVVGVLIWREIRLRDAVMGRRDVDPDADANGRMRDSIVSGRIGWMLMKEERV